MKENRELLIRIHRYLAWVLQAGAEVDTESTSGSIRAGSSLSSGSIAEQDLKVLLREFLEKDGSDPALVDRLFGGMVERVVAIVSRVQGLYEFDVQTLREYFAARHLYETAPYSPAGNERHGTKTDRWCALSRNFYWFNVARFYAGCYSEGEISSLIDELRVLGKDDFFRRTSHPQLLTATLLGDWVFSQKPRAIQDAVDLLLEPRGLRMLVADAGPGFRQVEEVIVRDPAGRNRVIEACKELIRPNRPMEQVTDIVRSVLRPNSERAELLDWWIEELRSADDTQTKHWCVLGEQLQCWSVVDLDIVTDLLGRKEIPSSMVISGLLHANRMDLLESTEELFEAAVEAVLSGESVGRSRSSSLLQRMALSVERTFVGTHDSLTVHRRRLSLLEYRNRFGNYEGFEDDIDLPSHATVEPCARLVQAFTSAAKRPLAEWSTSTDPWNQIVQQGVSEFGERHVFLELANLAAGIRSKEEKCEDSPNLFDIGQPMVRRARYARLRAGSRRWWSRQLQSATNADEVWMALLLFATWAGARTIEELVKEFDKLIASLATSEWRKLFSALSMTVSVNSLRSWIKPPGVRVSLLPSTLSVRTASILAERCAPATADELYERYLTDYKGDDSIVLSLCADVQVRRALEDETKWSQAIEGLRSSYELGAPISTALFEHVRFSHRLTLSDTAARKVVDQPLDFPATLVRAAEAHYRQLDEVKIQPVGRVATDEGWFED